ncbi:MAG: integrase arm-type DNA-binding domain-containing protein [Hyphomicrobiaceae bacterium]|nr:integrase arm-type DNA-binding domain-containing protein [Hyphomicrobiaceae bacterium]
MGGHSKLTALKVSKLKAPGRYGDGGGLWLQVSQSGTKSWLFRFMIEGRARQMGLGAVHTVGLADARARAQAARALLLDGLDPIEAREKRKADQRAEVAKRVTFRDAADRYIAAHAAGWRNAKHAAQWRATLDLYAFPVIGDLSVATVETAHVLRILEPIWAAKTETASRVRGRIEAVLDWAAARRHRAGDNPARWRGHLDKLLPARAKVQRIAHHPAMPFAQLPLFMAELRARGGLSARALEFTILTAARTGETIAATWVEVDLEAAVWTVPAGRMKSGREHRVPLSKQACSLLHALPRVKGSAFVFPGGRAGRGLSNMALLEQLRGMRGRGLTVHGFRSAFRDWCGECTNFPREVAEAALAHVVGDKAEQAYRRGDALEKRRELMAAWAAFCEGK